MGVGPGTGVWASPQGSGKPPARFGCRGTHSSGVHLEGRPREGGAQDREGSQEVLQQETEEAGGRGSRSPPLLTVPVIGQSLRGRSGRGRSIQES